MYPEYDCADATNCAIFRGARRRKLLLTNGGDDALRVFFDTFVEPGSHILICEPTFPMYRYYAEIAGARVEASALRARRWNFPLEEVVAGVTARSPRVFFLANPNNPTGTLVPKETITKRF